MAERVGFENTKKRTFNKIQRNGWRTFRSVDDVLMRDSKQIPVATDLELFKGGQPACPGSWKADFNLHARFSLHCLLKHCGGPATTACEPFRRSRQGVSLLTSLLFGVQPHDPATFAAVGAILIVVTLIAVIIPARRVTRIDPVRALGAE